MIILINSSVRFGYCGKIRVPFWFEFFAIIITEHIRSTKEGNVFHVILFTDIGGGVGVEGGVPGQWCIGSVTSPGQVGRGPHAPSLRSRWNRVWISVILFFYIYVKPMILFQLLPPASKGWRKVVFSLCQALQGGGTPFPGPGGGYPLPRWGVPPSQVQVGGG